MNMRRIILFSITLMLFISCSSTSVKKVTGPDGTEHILIECEESSARCIEEAGKKCPKGYVVIYSDGKTGTAIIPLITPYGSSFIGGSVYNGTLMIKCK
jgi:hypothetical protein